MGIGPERTPCEACNGLGQVKTKKRDHYLAIALYYDMEGEKFTTKKEVHSFNGWKEFKEWHSKKKKKAIKNNPDKMLREILWHGFVDKLPKSAKSSKNGENMLKKEHAERIMEIIEDTPEFKECYVNKRGKYTELHIVLTESNPETYKKVYSVEATLSMEFDFHSAMVQPTVENRKDSDIPEEAKKLEEIISTQSKPTKEGNKNES